MQHAIPGDGPSAALSIALIELRDIRKRYGGGDSPAVEVLRGVSLSIQEGEFVAIVGASGSGKSTLMHILGCLDRPSSGEYLYAGRDVAELDPDALAWLRREAFGFVFQGYHLIPTESALENVAMPAVYAGLPAAQRESRATRLLTRLGLAQRLDHRPNQLSGGQQQRVAIARALMNGGRIILADEPTGALDTRSGAEVMALLEELASQGHTIILITHDRTVAQKARRIIDIRDGQIVADTGGPQPISCGNATDSPRLLLEGMAQGVARTASVWSDIIQAARAAWRVMWINRFRTSLTLLGIIIGVASVIVMLAIGHGTRERVVAQMGAFGSNLLYISSVGISSRVPGRSITLADLEAMGEVPNIAFVLPNSTGNKVVRFGSNDVQTYIRGTGAALPHIQTWPLARGTFFSEADDRQMAAVAVLGHVAAQKLMPGIDDPLGRYVLIENVPFLVIGVMSEKGALTGDRDEDDLVIVPFSTAGVRIFGQREPTYTVLAVADVGQIDATQQAVEDLMLKRHGIKDFRSSNAAASLAAQVRTQDSMTVMLAMIATISLLVGGIGVMNVMLMTVKERTREIGIRMATGARQRDILRQFLTESTLVSVVGGVAGVVIGLLVGFTLIVWDVPILFSLTAIAGAFSCSVATGLVFGFMPARQAAGLDPVVALSGE